MTNLVHLTDIQIGNSSRGFWNFFNSSFVPQKYDWAHGFKKVKFPQKFNLRFKGPQNSNFLFGGGEIGRSNFLVIFKLIRHSLPWLIMFQIQLVSQVLNYRYCRILENHNFFLNHLPREISGAGRISGQAKTLENLIFWGQTKLLGKTFLGAYQQFSCISRGKLKHKET